MSNAKHTPLPLTVITADTVTDRGKTAYAAMDKARAAIAHAEKKP